MGSIESGLHGSQGHLPQDSTGFATSKQSDSREMQPEMLPMQRWQQYEHQPGDLFDKHTPNHHPVHGPPHVQACPTTPVHAMGRSDGDDFQQASAESDKDSKIPMAPSQDPQLSRITEFLASSGRSENSASSADGNHHEEELAPRAADGAVVVPMQSIHARVMASMEDAPRSKTPSTPPPGLGHHNSSRPRDLARCSRNVVVVSEKKRRGRHHGAFGSDDEDCDGDRNDSAVPPELGEQMQQLCHRMDAVERQATQQALEFQRRQGLLVRRYIAESAERQMRILQLILGNVRQQPQQSSSSSSSSSSSLQSQQLPNTQPQPKAPKPQLFRPTPMSMSNPRNPRAEPAPAAQAPDSRTQHVEAHVRERLSMYSRPNMKQLFKAFLKSAQLQRLNELPVMDSNHPGAEEEYKKAWRAIHGFKGNALALGLMDVVRACNDFRNLEPKKDAWDEKLVALRESVKESISMLRRIVGDPPRYA